MVGAVMEALRHIKAECGCSAAYTFEMLALDGDGKYDSQAWDRGEEMRIFSLAALPLTVFCSTCRYSCTHRGTEMAGVDAF